MLFNGKARCVSCHQFNSARPIGTNDKFHNIGVSARHQDFEQLAVRALRELEKSAGAEARRRIDLYTHRTPYRDPSLAARPVREPALTTVMFMAGAGGSLRAGVTENPIRLTRSIKEALVRVTSGGAPVYIWPGGGITYMVDVAAMPDNAFGHVPTPAIVAPIEFTMRLEDYRDLGGHMGSVRPVEEVMAQLHRTGPPAG